MNFLTVILSSLLSGLIGVLVANYIHFKNEKKRQKMIVLQQLLANRYHLRGDSL
jgi:hypothetical protein